MTQLNVLAGVQNLAGADVLAACVRGRVHVRDERERSGADALCGGKRSDGIAAAVHVDVFQAHREHFLRKAAGKLQLTDRRGTFGTLVVRRGGDGNVLKKSFFTGHGIKPPFSIYPI